jgi:hypothetical protein
MAGEGSAGVAGLYPSIRDNIAWVPDGTAGYLVKWFTIDTPTAGVYTTADYNWAWNFSNANRYFNYPTGNPAQYANVPGVHDTAADPLFADAGRNIITFGQRYKPSISTIHEVSIEMRKVFGKESGYDARFNLEDMYNWVRAGFRPRNPAAWASAHDGSHVGGVAPHKHFGVFAQ